MNQIVEHTCQECEKDITFDQIYKTSLPVIICKDCWPVSEFFKCECGFEGHHDDGIYDEQDELWRCGDCNKEEIENRLEYERHYVRNWGWTR
jgi:hypothetical protein